LWFDHHHQVFAATRSYVVGRHVPQRAVGQQREHRIQDRPIELDASGVAKAVFVTKSRR
jgi:hypothetical protein